MLHGNRTYLLMDEDGQIEEAHSISAGLDYPGIGPEHAWLNDMARVKFLSATDDEAVAAFQLCSKLEGIIPALEPARDHARVEAGVERRNDETTKRAKRQFVVVIPSFRRNGERRAGGR